MKSLFPRFFLSVWVASTLIAASFAFIQSQANSRDRIEWRHNLAREALRLEAAAAVAQARGEGHAEERLTRFREDTGASLYLFHEDGRTLTPKRPPQPVVELAARVRDEGELEVERDSATLIGFVVPGSSYVAVGRILRTPAWARALGTDTLALRLLVILVIAGLVSLGLARYLVRPLMGLRRATQRIAAGDLSARALPDLGRADGELVALAKDFDAMAERVQALVIAKERLLTDVSHELNSPLARLRVALELARARAGDPAQPALQRIEREAERLGALVAQILDLSRLEDQGLSASEAVQLAELLDEIAHDGDFEADAQQARVRVVRSASARVRGDRELLRRAIENVVRNALRYTAPGGEVEVELRVSEGVACVVVRDQGPGVPEAELRAIFEPLHRVEDDRARQTGGAGLGLAIAERAVRLHGGGIEARNRQGGGLEVTITLPVS